MKKLLCAVFALTMLAGCGGSKEAKVMKCSFEATQNGVNTVMNIDYEYSGDQVLKQIQKGTISTTDAEIYPLLEESMLGYGFSETLKDMDGVTYKLTTDKDKKEIVEDLTVDFEKVSAEDYKTVTNGQVDTKGKKLLVSLETTEKNMKSGGYTCTK